MYHEILNKQTWNVKDGKCIIVNAKTWQGNVLPTIKQGHMAKQHKWAKSFPSHLGRWFRFDTTIM